MDTKARLHSVKDVATILGIGRTKVWAHIKAGDINVVHLGRLPKVSDREVSRIEREGLPAIKRERG